MNIAVIGAGQVGTTLGSALRAKGHTVTYGSRYPANHIERNVKTVGQALIGADAVILATPWHVTEALVCEHAESLAGKIVIDAPHQTFDRRQQLGRRVAAKSGAPSQVLQGIQQHRRQCDGAAALPPGQRRHVRRRSRRGR